MALDIGRVAYQAYVDTLIKQNCDCDLSEWKEMGQYEQDAWRHAAVAVAQYLDEEKTKCEIEKDEDDAAFSNKC